MVATARAVYQQSPAPGVWVRLGWEQVGRIHWDERRGALVLTGWTPEAPARIVLAVPRDHALVPLACERVAWTMLLSARVPLAGHGHAQVTARRQPGTDRLLWSVVLGDGVADSSTVGAEVAAAITRLRSELGRWP